MVDIEELKKLPAEEKLRIIDELEASMEGEVSVVDEEELNHTLNERLSAYHAGQSTLYTWTEVQERLHLIKNKMSFPENA